MNTRRNGRADTPCIALGDLPPASLPSAIWAIVPFIGLNQRVVVRLIVAIPVIVRGQVGVFVDRGAEDIFGRQARERVPGGEAPEGRF